MDFSVDGVRVDGRIDGTREGVGVHGVGEADSRQRLTGATGRAGVRLAAAGTECRRPTTNKRLGRALAARWQPQRVLMDLDLPGMNGPDLQHALDQGCAAYLTKPFAADDLFALIGRHAP